MNDPSPIGDDNHGNACAGVIAASHNNEGIAGIAPNCKIMPIRIFDSNGDSSSAGSYTYQTTSGLPNGTWNAQMGYGVLNAYEAVQAACNTPVAFTNQTVTANTTITSCSDINVQNVTVTNNAKLTLDANDETIINGPFEVVLGAQLEVQ
ncbi:hypothetical protein FACS1894160_1860 [Bacteroidia bacterium]|nr:hypothetical protein FACS1894160_1860 [Bacteroidia bacterium]